jgi:AraC-like DNA-binding protein
MLHQLNIFLLLFGALQGWLLSIWFFRNQHKHLSNTFIGLLLFVVGLQLTSKVISKMWLMDYASLFYELSYKLPYLIGPLLYLYCKTTQERIFRTKDLWHFIPFAIACVWGSIGWRLFGVNVFPHVFTTAALQLISLGLYTYWSLNVSTKFIRQFITVTAAAEFVIIVSLALMVRYYGKFPDVRLLFVVLTGLIYWITWRVISGPKQFMEPEAAVVSLNLQKSQKYAHSSLTEQESNRIERLLQKLMADEKIYLDSSLTIEILSSRLSTSRHYLSQVLNERIKKTYADYINAFRLDESRKRLADPSNFRFTIAAVALDSGFSSVSSFNDQFKRRFGITPSKFRDQHLNKMSA